MKMPRPKELKTLSQISLDIFVEHLVTCWIKNRISNNEDCEVELNRFLRENIPFNISGNTISEIIKLYVEKYKLYTKHVCEKSVLPTASHLIRTVVIPQLTSLNLSSLVNINEVNDEDFFIFEHVLLSSLPILHNIVELSLVTHGFNVTLPICSDNILEHIGKNCQNLQSLSISFNSSVTDVGLNHLIPASSGTGCPVLERLLLYECSVTSAGVSNIVEYLPMIRMVGYREMGEVLVSLYTKFVKENNGKLCEGLLLTHINNLGMYPRRCGDVHKLARAFQILCPSLQNLKVRVSDCDVPEFKVLTALKSLEIIYNVGKPASPGVGTSTYLRNCGSQLNSLTLICGDFHVKQLKILGECCPNIMHLWIRCNNIVYDLDLELNSSFQHKFIHLETLYFRVGETEYDECVLPVNVLCYLLRNTSKLNELRLICRSSLITDMWLKQLWQCFRTDTLEKVLISLPRYNAIRGGMNLSMCSVHMILQHCPNLHTLENLLVWNVSREECEELRAQAMACNLNLNVTYRIMKIS